MKQWILNFSLSILAIFAPAKELFIAAGVLIVADLLTGIYAAYKLKQPITSAGIRRTVSKMLIYNVAIGAAFLVQKYMMNDAVAVASIVGSAIGLTELKSIIENLDKISDGDLMKSILARLGSVNDTLAKKDQQ